MSDTDTREAVRQAYAGAALRVVQGQSNSCCGGSCGAGSHRPDHGRPLQRRADGDASRDRRPRVARLRQPDRPRRAAPGRGRARPRQRRRHRRAALGAACRPHRQGLRPGHDRRDAGPRASRTSAKAGATNVEFLKGTIEEIPLPDNTVDVIISNCVINLSVRQAPGVRRGVPGAQAGRPPGGVRRGDPGRRAGRQVRHSMELWVGCVAGALEEQRVHLAARAKPASPMCPSSRRGSISSRTPRRSSVAPGSMPRCWRARWVAG